MQTNNLRLKKCDCTDFIDWLIENCTQCNGTIGLIRVDHIDDGLEEKKSPYSVTPLFLLVGSKGCLERQNSRHDPSFVPHFGWHRWKSFTCLQRLGDCYFPTHFQKLAYQHEVLTVLSNILALPILVY